LQETLNREQVTILAAIEDRLGLVAGALGTSHMVAGTQVVPMPVPAAD